jgi:hypothetical protein
VGRQEVKVPRGCVIEDHGAQAELVSMSARPEIGWRRPAPPMRSQGGRRRHQGGFRAPVASRGDIVGHWEEGRPVQWLDASTSAVTRRRQGERVSGIAHVARWPDGEGEEKKGKWASLWVCSR